jgi:hypothetical protein
MTATNDFPREVLSMMTSRIVSPLIALLVTGSGLYVAAVGLLRPPWLLTKVTWTFLRANLAIPRNQLAPSR